MYIFDGTALYKHGRKVGELRGELFDHRGRVLGSFKGGLIFDAHGVRIGSVRGDHVYDATGKSISSAHELAKLLDHSPTVANATIWLLLGK